MSIKDHRIQRAVTDDLSTAWAIMDDAARRTAEVRDLLAKAWCDIEDLHRLDQLEDVRRLLERAMVGVDEGIRRSKLTASDRTREWKMRKMGLAWADPQERR